MIFTQFLASHTNSLDYATGCLCRSVCLSVCYVGILWLTPKQIKLLFTTKNIYLVLVRGRDLPMKWKSA